MLRDLMRCRVLLSVAISLSACDSDKPPTASGTSATIQPSATNQPPATTLASTPAPSSTATARPSTTPPCDSDAACRAACDECGSTCSDAASAACQEDGQRRLRGEPPKFDVAAAARSFDRACEAGKLDSCVKLGVQLQDGRGIQRDTGRALDLYERACQGGVGVGCYNLVLWYRSGRGGPDGEPKAKSHFARALAAYDKQCSGAAPTYCENLGYLHEAGRDVPKDLAAAEAAYRRGCDSGGQVACLQLGLLELTLGRDVESAKKKLETACERDVGEACGAMGQHIGAGIAPFQQDVERALELLDRGCSLGSPQSCQDLAAGLLAERGESARAQVELKLARACALGASSGCFFLAKGAMKRGLDAPAFTLLSQACAIGHPEACSFVGASYQVGRSVPVDKERALAHYEDACHLGDFASCVEVDKAGRPFGLSPEREASLRAQAKKAGIKLREKKP